MSTERAREVLFEAIEAVAPDVEAAALDPTELLREQADLDSMDFLEVVSMLTDALGADIPTADYPKLDTINSATAYLGERLT